MDVVISIIILAFFMTLMFLLYQMEVQRYKTYIAKEKAQIALYQEISHKLDRL